MPPLGLLEKFEDIYKVILILDDRENFVRLVSAVSWLVVLPRLGFSFQDSLSDSIMSVASMALLLVLWLFSERSLCFS